jgi:glyoxylase-like metal-dependent hydrolase (beta-lactamase superfamily II)
MSTVHPIDTHYDGVVQGAAAFLLGEGPEAAFVETNTALAWPHLHAALTAQGYAPEDVRWVFVTHAHLDHAGGAWRVLEACPNATLVAHPRAAPHLVDPTKLVRSAKGVYGEERFEALYGELQPIPADRVRTVADGETLSWGARTLTFLHTRGHANHHYVLHDPATRGVFTGDAFGIAYPVLQRPDQPWVFPSTSPTDFDGPAAIASVDRIVATGATTAWLTHWGALTDLPRHADALKGQLAHWTRVVEAADASGLEGDDLAAHMRAAVAAHFDAEIAARGVPADQRALLDLDIDLNAQGLTFAVEKARYKRSRA